jgi:argininosuccinate lyase
MVALTEDENKGMDELTIEQFQGVDKRFGDDVLSVFDYERSVELKDATGGTSRRAVLEQLEALQKTLGVDNFPLLGLTRITDNATKSS